MFRKLCVIRSCPHFDGASTHREKERGGVRRFVNEIDPETGRSRRRMVDLEKSDDR
jgi:hypothetical protein